MNECRQDDAERSEGYYGFVEPPKIPKEQRMRDVIHGQGLSMRAMSDEIKALTKDRSERDATIRALTQERDDLREENERLRAAQPTGQCGACMGVYPNPECPHIENNKYAGQAAPCFPLLASPQPDAGARENAGQKIVAGLEDALAFVKGDVSRARIWSAANSPLTPPLTQPPQPSGEDVERARHIVDEYFGDLYAPTKSALKREISSALLNVRQAAERAALERAVKEIDEWSAEQGVPHRLWVDKLRQRIRALILPGQDIAK